MTAPRRGSICRYLFYAVHSRCFIAYKFRSMVPDAEKGEAIWARKDDQRVTRVGRFLRKTHVDEFP
jgi:lipopolysaccharide/colanic/teichoic acid biosynthesis glycosyltransferase